VLSVHVVHIIGILSSVRILLLVIFKRSLTHVTRLTGFSRRSVCIRVHDIAASLATTRRRRILDGRLV
jgi:hypothetical protein